MIVSKQIETAHYAIEKNITSVKSPKIQNWVNTILAVLDCYIDYFGE